MNSGGRVRTEGCRRSAVEPVSTRNCALSSSEYIELMTKNWLPQSATQTYKGCPNLTLSRDRQIYPWDVSTFQPKLHKYTYWHAVYCQPNRTAIMFMAKYTKILITHSLIAKAWKHNSSSWYQHQTVVTETDSWLSKKSWQVLILSKFSRVRHIKT